MGRSPIFPISLYRQQLLHPLPAVQHHLLLFNLQSSRKEQLCRSGLEPPLAGLRSRKGLGLFNPLQLIGTSQQIINFRDGGDHDCRQRLSASHR